MARGRRFDSGRLHVLFILRLSFYWLLEAAGIQTDKNSYTADGSGYGEGVRVIRNKFQGNCSCGHHGSYESCPDY